MAGAFYDKIAILNSLRQLSYRTTCLNVFKTFKGNQWSPPLLHMNCLESCGPWNHFPSRCPPKKPKTKSFPIWISDSMGHLGLVNVPERLMPMRKPATRIRQTTKSWYDRWDLAMAMELPCDFSDLRFKMCWQGFTAKQSHPRKTVMKDFNAWCRHHPKKYPQWWTRISSPQKKTSPILKLGTSPCEVRITNQFGYITKNHQFCQNPFDVGYISLCFSQKSPRYRTDGKFPQFSPITLKVDEPRIRKNVPNKNT